MSVVLITLVVVVRPPGLGASAWSRVRFVSCCGYYLVPAARPRAFAGPSPQQDVAPSVATEVAEAVVREGTLEAPFAGLAGPLVNIGPVEQADDAVI